jgi:putative methyltransferase (TIGR04325 family)
MTWREWGARFIHRSQSLPKTDLTGDYKSWKAVSEASTGYDSDLILEKTLAALLKVRRGDAAFERDSVLFDSIEYNWPLVAGLLLGAAESGGTLNVLDFGGSLGSTYFQNRRILLRLPHIQWNVVEQKRHVEIGRATFQDDTLRFFSTIEECLDTTTPNTILLSSVLQYVEDPDAILARVLSTDARVIIIDRTPFLDGPNDRLCVQHVPSEIYKASYPSWIFSRARFHSLLPSDWEIVASVQSGDTLTAPFDVAYEGLILVKKAAVPEPRMRNTISSGVDQY